MSSVQNLCSSSSFLSSEEIQFWVASASKIEDQEKKIEILKALLPRISQVHHMKFYNSVSRQLRYLVRSRRSAFQYLLNFNDFLPREDVKKYMEYGRKISDEKIRIEFLTLLRSRICQNRDIKLYHDISRMLPSAKNHLY